AAGCETNLGAANNCGKCGHDCLGGGCSNGACTPATLGTEQNNVPIHFVMDSTYIYGINAYGTVTRRQKDGGGAKTLVNGDPTPQWPPPHIALNPTGDTLFYTGIDRDGGTDAMTGSVGAVLVDGGGAGTIASGNAPYVIAATNADVIWSESA